MAAIGIQRVLICHEERHVVRLLRVNLERQGHHVALAENVSDGLARAADAPFDRVVLSATLPGGDSYAILERIRTQETGRDAWVTVKVAPEDRPAWEARPYRADDYIP